MKNKQILVPFDFTDAAENAVAFAILIAKKNGMGISLLHINDQSVSGSDSKLRFYINMLELPPEVYIDYILKQGNVIAEITKVSNEQNFSMMVIGSHGYKGIREKILGADILKLVKDIPLPVIVIQKDYKISEQLIKNIILPLAPHESFQRILNASISLSKIFDAEIHLFSFPETSRESTGYYDENIELATTQFKLNHVKYKPVKLEPLSGPTSLPGQILAYAGSLDCALISILSSPTSVPFYFTNRELELLLTNNANIPVLCSRE